ncbi:MAG: 30S ribosomal protein S21 [Phycisphaerales bacterium]|nr:30S ribosomal protein S21 [Phycisphaerales bacterium]
MREGRPDQDIRRKEYYEKPSERRRRAARKSVGRKFRTDAPVGGR